MSLEQHAAPRKVFEAAQRLNVFDNLHVADGPDELQVLQAAPEDAVLVEQALADGVHGRDADSARHAQDHFVAPIVVEIDRERAVGTFHKDLRRRGGYVVVYQSQQLGRPVAKLANVQRDNFFVRRR